MREERAQGFCLSHKAGPCVCVHSSSYGCDSGPHSVLHLLLQNAFSISFMAFFLHEFLLHCFSLLFGLKLDSLEMP